MSTTTDIQGNSIYLGNLSLIDKLEVTQKHSLIEGYFS